MKAQQVIQKLQSRLPQVSDLFTTNVAGLTLQQSGGLVTGVTGTPHGLTSGNFANISNATNPIIIVGITRSGTVATATTLTNHDLTLGKVDIKNGGKEVLLSGSIEPEFNGLFKLLSVANRQTFQFEVTDSGPVVAMGDPLLENGSPGSGFNGWYQITVLTSTTFTYQGAQTLAGAAGGIPELKYGTRISGAADLDHALSAYTKEGEGDLWAFVVLGDVIASKDRNVNSDLTETITPSTSWQQRVAQPFTVYIFATVTQEAAGRAARDLMEDISAALFKSILGVQFDTGYFSSEQYVAAFLNHGFASYDSAIYIHEFNFEMAADLVFEDTIGYGPDVAFRDIDFSIVSDFGTQRNPATATIDLDEEPIP